MKIVLLCSAGHEAATYLHKALCLERASHLMTECSIGYFDSMRGTMSDAQAVSFDLLVEMDRDRAMDLAKEAGEKTGQDFALVQTSMDLETITLKRYAMSVG